MFSQICVLLVGQTIVPYSHAIVGCQAQAARHFDTAVNAAIITLMVIPGTQGFGLAAGALYGGYRIVLGQMGDQWINKEFSQPKEVKGWAYPIKP
ncbi:MAG: hypothetical protein CMI36_09685 [Owenweeksia sp.]|nr:hypothetical protein [Owenweeksia sp.]MBF99254.1 hypothetical protein [Owenweeksia sp.]HBF22090.1 hypothetical protein [Cryomorphaceae bacterium]HCQ15580.1 hypothetical protein [Cryomorphaceae bacterium]|tara:strand:- start:1353 stop:1637 length:285 start_codon:yes stop_codon:yes gene_type:complete